MSTRPIRPTFTPRRGDCPHTWVLVNQVTTASGEISLAYRCSRCRRTAHRLVGRDDLQEDT